MTNGLSLKPKTPTSTSSAIADHHFHAAARAVELQAKLVRDAARPLQHRRPPLIEGAAQPSDDGGSTLK